MAGETLSIQQNNARLTVTGKSKADLYIDSGLGLDLGDLSIGSLDPLDLNWNLDVDDPDNLPDEIRIITPPTKSEYSAGEKIDLTGAVVGAYKNDSIWTSTKYPNGHIPLAELIVDPIVITEDVFVKVTVNNIDYYVSVNKLPDLAQHFGYSGPPWKAAVSTYALRLRESARGVLIGVGKQYLKPYANRVSQLDSWNEPGGYFAHERYVVTDQSTYYDAYAWIYARTPGESDSVIAQARSEEYKQSVLDNASLTNAHTSIVKNGKTAYISGPNSGLNTTAKPSPTDIPGWESGVLKGWLQDAAWEALYGNDRICIITLSWLRPSDEEVLSTTFTVDVLGSEESESGGGR